MAFDKEAFYQFMIDNRVVEFREQPIVLKSKRESHLYINWRTAMEDVFLTDRLTDMVLEYLDWQGIRVDTLYGVPEAATKLALLAQFKLAKRCPDYRAGSHVLAMGRGKPKDEHGNPKDRYLLGQPKGLTLVIEDVTTTAASAISAAKLVEQGGVSVTGILSLFNRMNLDSDRRSAEDACREAALQPFQWIGAADELLPRAYATLQPGHEIADRIEEEYRQFGVKPILLR